MKKYLIIFSLIGICFSQKSYNEKHLVEQNGVWYKKFSDEVVNGTVFKEIDGIEAPLGKMKDGKKEGKWMSWNDNGTKKEEQHFKNGKKDGHWKIYRKDGSKFEDQYYLNGKKTGKWLTYDKDGLLGQSITYQSENTYELNTYNKSGGLATSGIIKNENYHEGTFITYQKRNPIDNSFGRSYKFHTIFNNGEFKKLIEINENGDTLSLEDIIDGERVKTHIRDEKLNRLVKYVDPREKAERVLVYEEGLFKVYYQQYKNLKDINTIDFELENSYNTGYSSVWFMITAKKDISNEDYSKRIAFYDVEKNSTTLVNLLPYGNAVLKDIKLEKTRTRK